MGAVTDSWRISTVKLAQALKEYKDGGNYHLRVFRQFKKSSVGLPPLIELLTNISESHPAGVDEMIPLVENDTKKFVQLSIAALRANRFQQGSSRKALYVLMDCTSTAANRFILANLFDKLSQAGLLVGVNGQANFKNIMQSGGPYAGDIARAIHVLNQIGLLAGENAQTNFDAITQGGGRYAGAIAIALRELNQAGLLSAQNAQVNFMIITQYGGQYVKAIASLLIQGGWRYVLHISSALHILNQAGLLRGENAQANFDAITEGSGQYAKLISSALYILNQAGLLSGGNAQANFNAITQGGGHYARDIARTLGVLNQIGLLAGENAQTNFDAITQGGGHYARDIARTLGVLNQIGLLAGENAQTNFDAITQGGGHYARDIARTLGVLNQIGLLAGENAQANFDAITQGGGHYARDIARTLGVLNQIGLLAGENAQTNFVKLSNKVGEFYSISFTAYLIEQLAKKGVLNQTAYCSLMHESDDTHCEESINLIFKEKLAINLIPKGSEKINFYILKDIIVFLELICFLQQGVEGFSLESTVVKKAVEILSISICFDPLVIHHLHNILSYLAQDPDQSKRHDNTVWSLDVFEILLTWAAPPQGTEDAASAASKLSKVLIYLQCQYRKNRGQYENTLRRLNDADQSLDEILDILNREANDYDQGYINKKMIP